MATLALSLVGQMAGGALGGPLGATVGRALGALAGNTIDQMIFGGTAASESPSVAVSGASEGAPIQRLYGWARLSGNIIWASELEDLDRLARGAKGTSPSKGVGASFALALCEGEVHRLGRIWADGQLLDTSGLTIRFYRGTETQLPDSFISALQPNTPAYRGLCYLVFERLPLKAFGNRIPVLAVEVCRRVGDLEPMIEAVTVIPGATEFGYDPVARVRLLSAGETTNENAHQSANVSDWTLSIDELQALCPNLREVSLVVAWFGDDLRAASCTLAPRVEAMSREVRAATWSVAGLTRDRARVVSLDNGSPAYGGTPSDAAVLAALADLKARGLKATLYPIILMDIPAGNAMGQPPYPWRGRIGVSAAASGTVEAASEVAAFAAQYRAMILHYAGLARRAGVDTFLLGSEMVGMTSARASGTQFPFVTALVALAAEVKTLLGAGTLVTYGADWSEYSGVQDGKGEKIFHLDPLWASPSIGAVGIDNYLPLGDWRDGGGPDSGRADSPYDVAYLQSQIEGGEGFDWYYASAADRMAGRRSPITDVAYGEPWVWRAKDVRSFWSKPHYDRPGGVRMATPTAWQPGMKPLLFTELGCGAVDKGANQPNVFADPKSSEGALPYFSNGVPDPLMQRQALRAVLGYWRDPARNPLAPNGQCMLAGMTLWTWDARPFPAFPLLSAVWTDGGNHATGHWLTGRLGGLASDEVLLAMARDWGVTLASAGASQPFVQGQVIAGPMTARRAMEAMLTATGATVRDTARGLVVAHPSARAAVEVGEIVDEDGPVRRLRRADPGERVGAVSLAYADRERAYQSGAVTVLSATKGALLATTTDLVLDAGSAHRVATQLLSQAGDRGETLEMALPPSALALEVGDVIGAGGTLYEVTEIRDALARRVLARQLPGRPMVAQAVARPAPAGGAVTPPSIPNVVVAHLPPVPEAPLQSRLAIGAYAKPWKGSVAVNDAATGELVATAAAPASIGTLTAAFMPGTAMTWDMLHPLTVSLSSGHLSSLPDADVLAGANRVAVETDAGEWEIVGFANAELIASGTYRLTRLLRGQGGSDMTIGPAGMGRRVLVLDDAVEIIGMRDAWRDAGPNLVCSADGGDAAGVTVQPLLSLRPGLPLPPTLLRGVRAANGDVTLSWLARSRADANGWAADDAPNDYLPLSFEVAVLSGTRAVRLARVGETIFRYPAAQQTADFGSLPARFDFTVARVSPLFGPGATASGRFRA